MKSYLSKVKWQVGYDDETEEYPSDIINKINYEFVFNASGNVGCGCKSYLSEQEKKDDYEFAYQVAQFPELYRAAKGVIKGNKRGLERLKKVINNIEKFDK